MNETDLDQAKARVFAAEKRVEAQREILARLTAMHGDTTLGEQLLSELEADLADAEKKLTDLIEPKKSK